MPRSKTISALLALLQCVALGVTLLATSASARSSAGETGIEAIQDCVSIAGDKNGDRKECARNHCCILRSPPRCDAQADVPAGVDRTPGLVLPAGNIIVMRLHNGRMNVEPTGWTRSHSSRGPPFFF